METKREYTEAPNAEVPEVDDILGSGPQGIFLWGQGVLLLLFIILIVLSAYVHYPDVLTAKMTLTTQNPPVSLTAKSEGPVAMLLVVDHQMVASGQGIAVLENTAEYCDMMEVNQVLSAVDSFASIDLLLGLKFARGLQLGEATATYLSLLKAQHDLNWYLENNPIQRELQLLQADQQIHKELLEKVKEQETIAVKRLSLSEKDYKRFQTLHRQAVIADQEFDLKRKEYLAELSAYQNVKISASTVQIQLNSLDKNILALHFKASEELVQLQSDYRQQLGLLRSAMNAWKSRYMIVSPKEGKISFNQIWAEGQNVRSGDALFTVIPLRASRYIAKCLLPAHNAGKVKIGQKVNIKLDNYAFQEYGMLEGAVLHVSSLPKDGLYSIDVALIGGLTSSYQKEIKYQYDMSGQADIITDELSIMDRIFFNLRSLLSVRK